MCSIASNPPSSPEKPALLYLAKMLGPQNPFDKLPGRYLENTVAHLNQSPSRRIFALSTSLCQYGQIRTIQFQCDIDAFESVFLDFAEPFTKGRFCPRTYVVIHWLCCIAVHFVKIPVRCEIY